VQAGTHKAVVGANNASRVSQHIHTDSEERVGVVGERSMRDVDEVGVGDVGMRIPVEEGA